MGRGDAVEEAPPEEGEEVEVEVGWNGAPRTWHTVTVVEKKKEPCLLPFVIKYKKDGFTVDGDFAPDVFLSQFEDCAWRRRRRRVGQ